MRTDNLVKNYSLWKKAIKSRLAEFKKKIKSTDKELFAELCFCILTPQSKAKPMLGCRRAAFRKRQTL